MAPATMPPPLLCGAAPKETTDPGGTARGLSPKCPPGLQVQRKCMRRCVQVRLCVPAPRRPQKRTCSSLYTSSPK
eukprot:10796618-Alexandrium_andersonii.AAC.1